MEKALASFLILFILSVNANLNNNTSKNKFTIPDFNVEDYISVKDKTEWFQYLADYQGFSNEDNAIWSTINPIICYLAVRVFPLEYVEELQKSFLRMRFSTNCGTTKDIVLTSPLDESDPYNKTQHPKNVEVCFINLSVKYIQFSILFQF